MDFAGLHFWSILNLKFAGSKNQISNTVFPHIVSTLEYFPPLNSFGTFMYCDLWPYVL